MLIFTEMMTMNKEQIPTSRSTSRTSYSHLPNMKLPESYAIRDGFLCKGSKPATLVTSGVVEAAIQGFLHVDEAGEYEIG